MTGIHYLPNHLHRAFAHRRTILPTAERLGREILTLPLFYEMTDEQVESVIAAVCRFFRPPVRVVRTGARNHSAATRQPAHARSESP